MEWGIFFTVIGLYTLKFVGFAREYLKNPEPQGPFRSPRDWQAGGVGQEVSMNNMTACQIDTFIAALRENTAWQRHREYNQPFKRGLIPEKVNWKEEGF